MSQIDLLIVGGAPIPKPEEYGELVAAARYVVAVDSGIGLCLGLGIEPDVAVGDMDSVAPHDIERVRRLDTRVVRLDARKDVSDLGAALDLCRRENLGSPVVCAVTGGRTDHQLAVLGVLAQYVDLAPRIVEPDLRVEFLSADAQDRLEIADRSGALVSVIPLDGPATVTLKGMRYPLDRVEIPALSDLGLSNVVESDNACIRVHRGIVGVFFVQGAR